MWGPGVALQPVTSASFSAASFSFRCTSSPGARDFLTGSRGCLDGCLDKSVEGHPSRLPSIQALPNNPRRGRGSRLLRPRKEMSCRRVRIDGEGGRGGVCWLTPHRPFAESPHHVEIEGKGRVQGPGGRGLRLGPSELLCWPPGGGRGTLGKNLPSGLFQLMKVDEGGKERLLAPAYLLGGTTPPPPLGLQKGPT